MKSNLTANMGRHIGLPLLLTLAITILACSSDSDNSGDPNTDGGDASSSSGGGGSSSSGTVASNVESVTIGTQVWMKKNLDVAVDGSKCYNDDPANCATYGKLYTWAMAMDLPESYNTSSCETQAKHKGICPSGWHIPSDAEWIALINYLDDSSIGDTDSRIAGKYLKATSGWDDKSDGSSGNGDNTSGFAAMPGGNVSANGSFQNIGSGSNLWSSNEHSTTYAHDLSLSSNDRVDMNSTSKSKMFSVRCIKD